MKKILARVTLFFLILVLVMAALPGEVLAADCVDLGHDTYGINAAGEKLHFNFEIIEKVDTYLMIVVESLQENTEYVLRISNLDPTVNPAIVFDTEDVTDGDGKAEFVLTDALAYSHQAGIFQTDNGDRHLQLRGPTGLRCGVGEYHIRRASATNSCNVSFELDPEYDPPCADVNSTVVVRATDIIVDANPYSGTIVIFAGSIWFGDEGEAKNGALDPPVRIGPLPVASTPYQIRLVSPSHSGDICKSDTSFQVIESCANRPTGEPGAVIEPIKVTCDAYVDEEGNPAGIDTALGCIPTDPQLFIRLALPWAMGIGGGLAFLLMLYGVLMIIVSGGDPEKMQAGKEMITSAIMGLVIIIFAVFIMRFIGVEVLGLFGD
jgi:hypothetical protein